jgi:hypothetical protein
MNEIKLIALYFYISERYEKELKYSVQRFSHNSEEPGFTDSELLTLYLFVMSEEKRMRIKEIHRFAQHYLLSWFPKLPSYQAFDHRADALWEVLRALVAEWVLLFMPADCSDATSVVDSYPIITCSAKREGKVAREITDKGYCSTKNIYYYGLKLHVLGWQRPGHIPWIESVLLSEASRHDLTVFKENWTWVSNRTVIGDKIYKDDALCAWMKEQRNTLILMPVKEKQGKPPCLRQWDKAAGDLFSAAVSRVRQPRWRVFLTGPMKMGGCRWPIR